MITKFSSEFLSSQGKKKKKNSDQYQYFRGKEKHTHRFIVKVKVTQLCLTFCDPMNYTVHGILQARILEWVAFPFSVDS